MFITKRFFHLLAFTILITLSFFSISSTAFSQTQKPKIPLVDTPVLLNQIVATVNNNPITQNQLKTATQNLILEAKAHGLRLPSENTLQKLALKKLIFTHAAENLATQNGIIISSDLIHSAIAHIASENNLSIKQLKQKLSQQGISFNQYQQTIHQQLLIQKLEQQAVASSIHITPTQIQQYLAQQKKIKHPNTQYLFEHILIALPSTPTPKDIQTLKQKANFILNKIKHGLSFTQAAMQYSDSGDADKGGKLPWETLETLPQLFSKYAVHMKTGEIIGPIQDSNGFHIFKLIKTRTPKPPQHFSTLKKVQMIQIKITPILSRAAALKRIQHFKNMIQSGVSFSQIAEKNSQDPISSTQGGNMGWVNPSDVPPSYAQAIMNTPKNNVSKPFEYNNSWCIIKILNTKKINTTQQFTTQQAENALFQQKALSILQTWREQVLANSTINILLPNLK